MTYENCKNCPFCEYLNETLGGVEYKGWYCGGYNYLTDNAKLENIDSCEWAD